MPVVNLSFESMAFKLYNTEAEIFPEDDNIGVLNICFGVSK